MDKKLIISLILALIAIIIIGFLALNFVPTGNDTDLNISNNSTNGTIIISQDSINNNVSDGGKLNDTNSSSNITDSGDILHKQIFTVSENETGQNEGMEPGTYIMYYTENDGPIKVEKIS
ncbi:hypothetical protein [Methanobrevibacter olleyae]|uniref:Uncharacterized protein n=1 Tax=Methanobrevibacter olleyae TaxID=294671 RepID=A0A126R0D8_METOL|nr:hypothetical protein [Methanobrevibacter olleyae]AMK15085.1 hypothetical protein YLM1_0528 [Methanobrevibacter olleyae]